MSGSVQPKKRKPRKLDADEKAAQKRRKLNTREQEKAKAIGPWELGLTKPHKSDRKVFREVSLKTQGGLAVSQTRKFLVDGLNMACVRGQMLKDLLESVHTTKFLETVVHNVPKYPDRLKRLLSGEYQEPPPYIRQVAKRVNDKRQMSVEMMQGLMCFFSEGHQNRYVETPVLYTRRGPMNSGPHSVINVACNSFTGAKVVTNGGQRYFHVVMHSTRGEKYTFTYTQERLDLDADFYFAPSLYENNNEVVFGLGNTYAITILPKVEEFLSSLTTAMAASTVLLISEYYV
jgi:hypothetical protein